MQLQTINFATNVFINEINNHYTDKPLLSFLKKHFSILADVPTYVENPLFLYDETALPNSVPTDAPATSIYEITFAPNYSFYSSEDRRYDCEGVIHDAQKPINISLYIQIYQNDKLTSITIISHL